MNWKWHYHTFLNVFFFAWFGFWSAESYLKSNWGGLIVHVFITFALAYWMVSDWQKDWREEPCNSRRKNY